MSILNILSILFISIGLFFFIAATVGLLRFPDIFCRLHATSKSDTLASLMMFTGIALHIFDQYGFSETRTILKIFLIIIFIAISSPVVAHALGRRAYKNGLVHWSKKDEVKTDVSKIEEFIKDE